MIMKMALLWIKVLAIILEFSLLTFAYSINDTKDLLTELFTNNAYNKKVRPIEDQTMAVNVTVRFYISGRFY